MAYDYESGETITRKVNNRELDPPCPECESVGTAIETELRRRREGAPKSMMELADLLGLQQADLSLRKRGLRHFRYCDVVKAAALLQIQPAGLVGDPGLPVELALRVLERAVVSRAGRTGSRTRPEETKRL